MSSNPSPAVAALLSLLFPGLGQIYAGDVRKGLIWAIPMVVFIFGVLWLVLGGMSTVLSLIQAQQRVALLVLNVAFFFYHVAAMVDAYDVAQRVRSRGYGYRTGAPLVLALLVSIAIVLHGVPGGARRTDPQLLARHVGPGADRRHPELRCHHTGAGNSHSRR